MDLNEARKIGKGIMRKLADIGFFEKIHGYPSNYLKEHGIDGVVDSGSTRMVLSFPELENYIIKFDTTHLFPYTHTEALVYEKAVAEGNEDFFAGVWFGDRLRYRNENRMGFCEWYLAEKCDCSDMEAWFQDKASEKNWGEYFYPEVADDSELLALAFGTEGEDLEWWLDESLDEIWGEENGEESEEYNGRCSDLHSGNYGLLKGRPVIVDYAGYSNSLS